MTNQHSAIAIYTGQSTEKILEEGGSQAWRLDPKNAQKAEYGVLCFNPNAEWSKGNVEHRAAFFVGKISGIRPSVTNPQKYIVLFSEYAEINMPNKWGHWRFPIKYVSLEDLGIKIEELNFQPMPEIERLVNEPETSNPNQPLTIEAAKSGLALTFGVKPEAIEITING